MSDRINAGYRITDSINIGETEFVIGQSISDPNQYVTWACSNGDNYFWGHYVEGRRTAEVDLVKRAETTLRILGSLPPPKRQDKER